MMIHCDAFYTVKLYSVAPPFLQAKRSGRKGGAAMMHLPVPIVVGTQAGAVEL